MIMSDVNNTYNKLKHDIQAKIPEEIKEKLNSVTSDSEASRILAENGVEISELEQVNGGFFIGNTSTDVVCKCGNRKREDFETLVIAGLTAPALRGYRYVFKCKKCKQLIGVDNEGKIVFISQGNTPLNPK
jgi:hypothetical protein